MNAFITSSSTSSSKPVVVPVKKMTGEMDKTVDSQIPIMPTGLVGMMTGENNKKEL